MIIGENRRAVIENIKKSAESGKFYNKVELNDPVLTFDESVDITQAFMKNRESLTFKIKSFAADIIARIATRLINKKQR